MVLKVPAFLGHVDQNEIFPRACGAASHLTCGKESLISIIQVMDGEETLLLPRSLQLWLLAALSHPAWTELRAGLGVRCPQRQLFPLPPLPPPAARASSQDPFVISRLHAPLSLIFSSVKWDDASASRQSWPMAFGLCWGQSWVFPQWLLGVCLAGVPGPGLQLNRF